MTVLLCENQPHGGKLSWWTCVGNGYEWNAFIKACYMSGASFIGP